MKTTVARNPVFPVEITPEEKGHGAKLIAAADRLIGGYAFGPSLVAKVVIPAGQSRRLVKLAGPLYQIEAYCADTHFMHANNPQKPSWQSVGDGPSSTIGDALRRANQEWRDFTVDLNPPADLEIVESDLVG